MQLDGDQSVSVVTESGRDVQRRVGWLDILRAMEVDDRKTLAGSADWIANCQTEYRLLIGPFRLLLACCADRGSLSLLSVVFHVELVK